LPESLTKLLTVAVPASLALSILVFQWLPLPPVHDWGAAARWMALTASAAGAGVAHLLPKRSGWAARNSMKAMVIVVAAASTLVVGLSYTTTVEEPPTPASYWTYNFVKTPILYCGAYFLGSYALSRAILAVPPRPTTK
jgi:hypothetical protein